MPEEEEKEENYVPFHDAAAFYSFAAGDYDALRCLALAELITYKGLGQGVKVPEKAGELEENLGEAKEYIDGVFRDAQLLLHRQAKEKNKEED